ncbi:MAG: hypothetical protein Fur005_28770 [Roseiflexaceae bacterium]
MGLSERAIIAIERIQEDERLRGDLPDEAAQALVQWAGQHASQIANDHTRSDDEVEALIKLVRSAARFAARTGLLGPQQVIDAAEAALRERLPNQPNTPTPTPEPAALLAPTPTAEPAALLAPTPTPIPAPTPDPLPTPAATPEGGARDQTSQTPCQETR